MHTHIVRTSVLMRTHGGVCTHVSYLKKRTRFNRHVYTRTESFRSGLYSGAAACGRGYINL